MSCSFSLVTDLGPLETENVSLIWKSMTDVEEKNLGECVCLVYTIPLVTENVCIILAKQYFLFYWVFGLVVLHLNLSSWVGIKVLMKYVSSNFKKKKRLVSNVSTGMLESRTQELTFFRHWSLTFAFIKLASNFITSVVCFIQEATIWLEWGKGPILRMSPGFVRVKVVYSSVREVEKCRVREAEIWGNKKKSLWLRQLSGAWWIVCCLSSVSTRGTQVAFLGGCSDSVLWLAWELVSICRNAELQVNSVGAKPPVKSCIALRTVKTGSEYVKFDIWSQGTFSSD